MMMQVPLPFAAVHLASARGAIGAAPVGSSNLARRRQLPVGNDRRYNNLEGLAWRSEFARLAECLWPQRPLCARPLP